VRLQKQIPQPFAISHTVLKLVFLFHKPRKKEIFAKYGTGEQAIRKKRTTDIPSNNRFHANQNYR